MYKYLNLSMAHRANANSSHAANACGVVNKISSSKVTKILAKFTNYLNRMQGLFFVQVFLKYKIPLTYALALE